MLNTGPLNLEDLDRPYVAIVQHFTQAQGVIHQVTLRPDKVKNGLIRIGETQGDELMGWQYPMNLNVIAVLGEAVRKTPSGTGGTDWECKPIEAANADDAQPLKATG